MQWRRLAPVSVIAVALLLAACLESSKGGGPSAGDGAAGATTVATTTAATDPAVTLAPVTEAPVTEPPTTATPATEATTPKVALGRNLRQGLKGDDVQRMQQRLIDMKFDPGLPDGAFGPTTTQAVWAYQKLIMGATGKAVNGIVTPELWDRMQDPLGVTPRRPNATPTHMEVFLPEQVAVLYKDGQLRLITHISTGSNKEWCGERKDGTQVCGTSITPGGTYKFYRRQSDWWEGDLGRMFNPVYFNYGIAVHGMTAVPNYPASHGCVRIPMNIAEYFPSLVRNGDQIFVWDGVKEPEKYGAQPPPFDKTDPNSTTTTVAPTTTVKAAPTTPKPTAPAATPPPTEPPTTPAPPTTAPPPTAAPSSTP